ncbi:MAG: hypothetical protein ACI897_001298, partial [Flavobacteriales bacterium]
QKYSSRFSVWNYNLVVYSYKGFQKEALIF